MDIISLLPGIIWSGFLGLALGNFATNPIYRLPRAAPLFVEDPYCDSCHAPLRPRDLFPVLSWLMTRGRCRYCGASVPGAYALSEALTALIFVLCYLRFGFSEQFILVSLGATSFVMMAMMLTLDDFFSNRTLVACLMLGMLHRTLQEGTLYGFAGSAFAGLLAGALAWKLSARPMTRDVSTFPAYLKLLVAAGVWLPLPQLCIAGVAMLAALALRRGRIWLPEWTLMACASFLLIGF